MCLEVTFEYNLYKILGSDHKIQGQFKRGIYPGLHHVEMRSAWPLIGCLSSELGQAKLAAIRPTK